MLQFWLALLVFIGSHAISRTPLRGHVIRLAGERAYFITYSSISFVLLCWLIYTAIQAPRTALWPWMHELYWVPNLFMPLACVLLTSGFLVGSPLSLMPRNGNFDSKRPPIAIAITRHPVLWGFFLWSVSHIFPNGDFPLAFMFLIFALFALAGTKMIDKKRQRTLGNLEWQNLSSHTTSIPFANKSFWRGQFSFGKRDLAGIAGGLALYAALFPLHRVFFGMVPIPPGI